MNKVSNLDKTSAQTWVVDSAYEGQRIDNFLFSRLKGLPKSRVYRILRKGEVRVNKKRIKPDYRIKANDSIRIPPMRLDTNDAPTAAPSKTMRQMLEKRVLYTDDNVVIINKPAGMAVHGGSGINLGVIESLRHMWPNERHLELAHRLDRDTSGCLLLAKKPSVLKQLHELFRQGQMEKIYLALVKGYWPKHVHYVDVPLKKYELRSGERMVNVDKEGKAALTDFRVIKRFDDTTLVEAKLHTGRTHQIRVHAAHAGHPIVGDEKYGDKDFNKQMRLKGYKRLFLHANSLSFVLPGSEQRITVKADLDPELQALL